MSAYENYLEEPTVTGLSADDNQIQVTILNLPTDFLLVNKVFEVAAENNLNIDMISMINDHDKVNVSFSIVESGLENVDKVFNGFLKNVDGTKINYKNGLVKISIVGVGMRKARGVASRF